MRKLDPDNSRPPYQQLAEAFRVDIDGGELQPGERLPSYDEIAGAFGVSLGVVKRALAVLRDERLIVIRHGQGSFVRTERGADATPTLAELSAVVAAMGDRLDALERRLTNP